MKAFIAGVITLCILIGAVITNAIIITSKTCDFIDETKFLSDTPDPIECERLFEKWERNRSLIMLTVHRQTIDDIDDTIRTLLAESKEGDENAYRAARERLLCQMERLRETEAFSFDRIF